MGTIIPEFPKFYIKAVGGAFSIEHRLTHTFISSVKTEEELVEEIARLNLIPDKELWEMLINGHATIPNPKHTSVHNPHAHSEEWYYSAWGIYTSRFYENNPSLLVEVPKIPWNIVNDIKREAYQKSSAETKAREDERRRFEEEEKEFSKNKDNFYIGDTKKAEEVRLRKVIKKKKTIKIKRSKSGINVPIVKGGLFD